MGKKQSQTQSFLENGIRLPVSVIDVSGNFVAQVKTKEKDGYDAIQIAFGNRKRIKKPIKGHLDKAGIKTSARFFREIKFDEAAEIELGKNLGALEIFQPGDIVDVSGVSKGKGFAGVVKRHHFKGGPRTHGQSDRERAPGSLGQTTTPGRVYKGKRMAGRMGHENVTVKNLEIIEVTNDGLILVKGLVPGGVNSLVIVKKVGENKKFVPLYKEVTEKLTVKPAAKEAPVKARSEAPVETQTDSAGALPVSDDVQEEEALKSPQQSEAPRAEDKVVKEEAKEGEQNANS